jgi:hypothetical protein
MAANQGTIDTITQWYSQQGRAPDAEGQAYWANEVATKGADAAQKAFSDSAKVVNDSTAQASSLYQSVLGRQGDAEGVDYWAGELRSGKSANDVGAAFRDSARTTYNDFLTNPSRNNPYASTLAGDLNTGVSPGTLSGGQRDVARTGLVGSIYANLYGADPKPVKTGVTTLDQNALARRTIDGNTETVRGQVNSLLDENSPFLQRARALGQRQAAERGLMNSSMAGTAGEAAAIDAALQIATPDASAYKSAGDYNTALSNQANMYNADALNAAATQQRGLNSQMSIAQMQDATSRYQIEKNDAASRYNTDAQYRRQADANADSLANNILMTTDLSPDRKAALLESLGKGTAPKRGADGKVIPGSGLAGSIYVIDSVAADLAQ